jgi:hypothetical protein
MNSLRRAAGNRAVAGAIVAVAALSYPIVVLAGGGPQFPSRDDCVVPATHDGNVELVFGYFDSIVSATAELARVRRMGYMDAEVVSDGGCARVKIAVPGYTTLAGARDSAEEARRAGLNPTIEQAD